MGDYMKREDIEYLLKVVIFIALFVVAIRFVIYLLPFVIIAWLVMLAYDSYKRNHGFPWQKKKKDDVKEAVVVEEKKS